MIENFNPITQTPFSGDHVRNIFEKLSNYLNLNSFSAQEALEYWPLLTRRTSIQRFLACNEIFKLTVDVPGDIIEFGVFQGHSLLTWANLLEVYCTTDRSKQVFGFDTWAGFPGFSDEAGSQRSDSDRKTETSLNDDKAYDRLIGAIDLYDADRFVSWKKRIKLIKGDIMVALPKFLDSNLGRRFSLVYLDLDIYKPAKLVLDMIWDRVPRGGVYVLMNMLCQLGREKHKQLMSSLNPRVKDYANSPGTHHLEHTSSREANTIIFSRQAIG